MLLSSNGRTDDGNAEAQGFSFVEHIRGRVDALRQQYAASPHTLATLLQIAGELLPSESDFLEAVRDANFRAMDELLHETDSLFAIFGPALDDSGVQENLEQQCAIANYLTWRINELPRISKHSTDVN